MVFLLGNRCCGPFMKPSQNKQKLSQNYLQNFQNFVLSEALRAKVPLKSFRNGHHGDRINMYFSVCENKLENCICDSNK